MIRWCGSTRHAAIARITCAASIAIGMAKPGAVPSSAALIALTAQVPLSAQDSSSSPTAITPRGGEAIPYTYVFNVDFDLTKA